MSSEKNNFTVEEVSKSVSRLYIDKDKKSYLGVSYNFPLHNKYSSRTLTLSLIEDDLVVFRTANILSGQSTLVFIIYLLIMTFIFYRTIRKELHPLRLMIRNFENDHVKQLPDNVLSNPTEIGFLGRVLNEYLRKINNLNEELLDAQEVSNMGSWVYNTATNEINCSEHMYQILPLPKNTASISSEEFSKFVYRNDLKRWKSALEKCTHEKKSFIIDYRCHLSDDKIIWIRSHGRYVLDEESRTPLIKATSQEITEVKSNQRNLELLAYASELGFVSWNLVTGVLTIDHYFRKIIGIKDLVQEIEYEDFIELVSEEDKEAVKESLVAYMQGRLEVFEMKYNIKHESGEYVPVLSKGKVIEKEFDGFPTTLSFTFLDLTNIQSMENELELQKKMNQNQAKLASIGELAAGVGHEINNPLTMVLGYMKKLEKKIERKDQMIEVKKIQSSLERIEKIATSLRSFTRMTDDRSYLDLSSVLREQFELVREVYEQDGIKIHFQTKVQHACIYGSMVNMQQVIMNLFSNARHALEKSPEKEIVVSLVDIDDTWEIQVYDSGCGIPKSSQGKIFNAFFREFRGTC